MPCGPNSAFEELTRQFHAWEVRGRGWQVWDAPVELEPPFRPFYGHFLPATGGGVPDDGRKPTKLSAFFDGLKRGAAEAPAPAVEAEPSPRYLEDGPPLVEVQVVRPAEAKTTNESAAQFLLSLGHVSRPVSFELVGTA